MLTLNRYYQQAQKAPHCEAMYKRVNCPFILVGLTLLADMMKGLVATLSRIGTLALANCQQHIVNLRK